MIGAQNLSYDIGGARLVDNVTVDFAPHHLTMVIGPNGAGKSSLLRLLAGINTPTHGTTQMDGEEISSMPPVVRARQIAYMPQQRALHWAMPVAEAVAIARYAIGRDDDAVQRAIDDCALHHLAKRRCDQLSGGEQARVHLANVLAQSAPVLILDEPLSNLDPAHALATLDVLRRQCDRGGTVIATVHDLMLAGRYADHIIAMKNGHIVANGTPRDVLTDAILSSVFDVDAQVTWTENGLDRIAMARAETSA